MSLEQTVAVRESERDAFGQPWCSPHGFALFDWTQIADYAAQPGGDGADVAVSSIAAPARFYRLSVAARCNSVGDWHPPYAVTTGSIDPVQAATLAKDISEGMLGFSPAIPDAEVSMDCVLGHPRLVATALRVLQALEDCQSSRESDRTNNMDYRVSCG